MRNYIHRERQEEPKARIEYLCAANEYQIPQVESTARTMNPQPYLSEARLERRILHQHGVMDRLE